ncbi:MAG: hypothetical protein LC138_08035 [Anaerolineales bacterium]|nr:hypothetical protein [Gammaproteobacteria bacterium]MCZ2288767.1 hypothetical protein [Anaerolineales bacterium]
MTNLKNSFTLYSLGLEELAMALGLINCPEMGRQLLASIYDNLTESQVESRLSSASHSMLARGLAAISDRGTPTLEKGLEQALFPLARFDYVLQISRVRDGKQIGATVHVQKGKSFTSHSIQAGVVHVLEHGVYKALPSYLGNTFLVNNGKETSNMKYKWSITPGVLGDALRGDKTAAISKILSQAGLPDSDAQNLADDLAHQTVRGTILRAAAGPDTDMQKLMGTEKQMLMMLGSPKRNWLFEFPATDDAVKGKAWTVNRQTLEKHLESFTM